MSIMQTFVASFHIDCSIDDATVSVNAVDLAKTPWISIYRNNFHSKYNFVFAIRFKIIAAYALISASGVLN